MKPRTKLQRQMVEWAAELPPLGEKHREWARGLFPAEALYYSRRGNHCEFHCMCCGAVVPTPGKWLIADQTLPWTCPECGAVCKVLPQYSDWRRVSKQPTGGRYVTLSTVFRGVQVFRTFDVLRCNGRTDGGRGCPTEYRYHEIFQNWITDGGKEVITCRPYARSFNYFRWDYDKGYVIGSHNAHCSGYYGFQDVFSLDGNWYFPGGRFTPLLRRNGMTARLMRYTDADASRIACELLRNNLFEEVVKSGQLLVAVYFLAHSLRKLPDYIHAVRICTRHGYRIKDPRMWLDYLDDLVYLGLDTHSPSYICPRDLRMAHARTYRLREREEERRKEEQRLAEIAKWEPRYSAAKAPFLGIVFGDGNITLSVIQSVTDVRAEGKAMHHCVFSNDYWKRPDTVLLTARDASGNRIETVEIGLDPYKVRQSRGLQNKLTPQHDLIVALCEANMESFRKAARKMTVPLHLTGKNANYYQD